MTRVGIIIPVRNCLHYTQAAIASIVTKHQYEVIVIDDHSTDGTKEWLQSNSLDSRGEEIRYVIDPEGSTGLAFNWNLGCKIAMEAGCTHLLVANNDILFHPETIDNLVERMEKGDVVMATGVNSQGLCASPEAIFTLQVGEDSETEHPDFSCFMITPETIEKVGWFDENFIGAYCEDCDYHARIALLNLKAITYNRAPYYHYASGTLKENPQLAPEIRQRHEANQSYFYKKWGTSHVSDVPVMREVYWHHPFNDPTKTPRDW